MTKLAGPLRREKASISFRFKGREVLLDKMYDPDDQMENFAKGKVGMKLGLLAAQLQFKGVNDEEIQQLLKSLVSLEKFDLMGVSAFLDCISQNIGNFHDPVFVIEAIADATKSQPDSKSAVLLSIGLARRFANLNDPEKETHLAAELKGN